MEYVVSDILLSDEVIHRRVKELAKQISKDYAGKELVTIGILKGAVIFLSDLIRYIDQDVDVVMDFMAVSSYGDSTKTSGIVKITKDIDINIRGKNVLIVEDIVDSGLTLSYLIRMMGEREPESIRVCVLLDKEERRKVPVNVDYKGFDIPDKFVVGYGLDYAGKWRNLPSIHMVDIYMNSPEEGKSMRGGDI
ncbi:MULTISPECIES: hypoxanthine phosphoribosyltransferase [Aminobacterium]|jgi:hypoxanthine phosphoribosyltransferase|uniref:Hypoxanthine phosphoribosyltransferase n=1 Tax=Aminobacterium colombiense (strain DSM 12261 / ALA-1) TaxID=572547 RepID=D5EEC9_AMICL|nr:MULTISPECIES: hypoxanthine phosphoribosyltransferase [Aminobacterium]MDD2379426.1 hypoxanthine phosphoribosyltransferase [Aminobacterium colombiense]ADE56911.1 hypoxanthine phosphoribosyltransferase [Aminobacterium colombiense DSM 12261]MDD3767550.1 hypoxanthine phosphoribosyltransferase [Aminobacterium colombiense]MDD4266077.1 hypoxanthine phosphoribosyltransferase [Aminobacterium colombiense]MDD4586331.1 hypoxanthine phosphoribosyltransferase [Aminobacterium colombiense]